MKRNVMPSVKRQAKEAKQQSDAALTALRASIDVDLVIGTTVQAWSENLDDWSALAPSDKQDALAQQAAIANPAGGATVDTEARTAVASMLTALRTLGLIAAMGPAVGLSAAQVDDLFRAAAQIA